jgi:RNA polymerase sigma factor (sigma-70 family)
MSEDRVGCGESANPDSSDLIDPESTFHLLDRARAGDQEALERLFERHVKPLQRWARGRLPRWARDLADTDDLVQDTLVQTFKRIEVFEPRRVGALQAYLRQAVLNRIRDELRSKRRQPDVTDLNGLELDRAESPLEQAIGREAVEAYEQALERLKPEEREAIIGRHRRLPLLVERRFLLYLAATGRCHDQASNRRAESRSPSSRAAASRGGQGGAYQRRAGRLPVHDPDGGIQQHLDAGHSEGRAATR